MDYRLPWLVVCLLVITGAAECTAADLPRTDVSICLQYATVTNFAIVSRSRFIAARLYEDIGVQLHWTCNGAADPIVVKLSGDTPLEDHPGAMAYALPYSRSGSRIIVFYDRLRSIIENRPLSAPAILGHVLAHEIGHVLEGVARHSERGLMRAHWSDDELTAMSMHPIAFIPENRALIRQALAVGMRNP